MNSDQDTRYRVGCPIRRSRDQRSLASPPGFSQRATSFIASQCQGIHQMPFSCFSRHTQRQTPPTKRVAFRRGRQAKPNRFRRSPQVQQSSPFRRHFVTEPIGQSPLVRATPAAASVAVTTRFFTIVHQQHPARPQPTGGAILLICRDVSVHPPAFRRLLRKRLSAFGESFAFA
jgi:hypothetical protein